MKINNSKLLIATGIMALAACNTADNNKEEESRKPNIIYIMADDLGYADIGVYGQKLIKTPNIDHLAANGMMFTQHYAGTSVCAPSRSVLMTGEHSGHTYVRGNKEVEPYGQTQLPLKEKTVAEYMKEAGYRTGMIGKWGLGVENTSGDPQKQGFDYFYGYYGQVHAHNSFPEYLYENGEKVMLDNEVNYLPEDHWTRGLGGYAVKKEDFSNDLFHEKSLEFISESAGQPFFLYLPVTIPHNNGEAPDPFKFETPSLYPYEDKEWTLEERSYAAMITRLDSMVGDIVKLLAEKELSENTLLIFTSDNGPEKEDIFDSNGILNGGKRDLTEGGIRVPFIASWPGTIEKGSKTDHVSAFWDFLPTACDIAGISFPDSLDGISYLPALVGEEQKKHSYLYWEFHERGGKQAVRMGKWKAIRRDVNEDPEGPLLLFNLEEDPSEKFDISKQHPEIVSRMKEIMTEAREPSPIFPFGSEIE
ncbi:MAG: arylsulfatase [bacterium]